MNYKNYLILILFLGVGFNSIAQNKGPERWENTIQQFEKQDSENRPPQDAILFVGSSSIAMWKNLGSYFPEYETLNRGFGGSQFSDLLHYTDRVIYPYKPSKIFIYEGDNDLAGGKSPQEILKEAKKLRKEIRKELPGVPVVFIAAKPSIARKHLKEGYEELNTMLKEYAAKEKNTMFADVYAAMMDQNGEVYDHIFLEDNLHMNEQGYEIWQSVLAPYLQEEKKD